MADPNDISEKTLINQGELDTLMAIKILAEPHDENQHPLSLFKEHIDSAELMGSLSLDEYKKHKEMYLRAATEASRNLIMKRLPEMQDKVLVTAYKILSEELSRLQGDPSQRIEVTKKSFSIEQLEELYKKLPKHVESEDISGRGQGTSKRSKRLDGNSGHTTKHKKGD